MKALSSLSLFLLVIIEGCQKEKIPTITTAEITSITETTAKCGGTITDDGGETVLLRGVCYSTEPNPTIKDSTTSDGAGAGTFISSIDGLYGGTKYFVRAYASNSIGIGYGMTMSFTTLGTPPKEPTVIIQSPTNIQLNACTLNGVVNPNYLSTTVIFEYGLTTLYGQSKTASQSPIVGHLNKSVSCNISDLIPATIYHYRLKAVNSLGTTYSNDGTVKTLGEIPSATTKNPSNIQSTSVTLNGTVNANNLSTTVTFDYGTTTNYGNSVSATQSPVSGNTNTNVSANLINLLAGTTYYYRVKALNSLGISYGDNMEFITLGHTPLCTTLDPTNIGTNSVTLNGKVNAKDLSTIVTFEYGLTESYGSSITAAQSPITGNIETQVTNTLSDLIEGSTYHYRVKAENILGTTYGEDRSFTTLGQKPTTITGNPTNITINSVTLNGSVNANYLSTIVTFEYGSDINYGNSISAIPSPITGNSTTSVSVNLTGLSEGSTYHFRLKAVNSLGINYGNDLTFSTLGQVPITITLDPSNISVNSAILNGSVNANYLTTNASFEYGTSTLYGYTISTLQNPISGNASTTVTANLTGLAEGTIYHVRLIATNSLGTTYGSDKFFKTLGESPEASTENPTNLQSTSVTLNGQVNANNLPTNITFEYGTSTTYGNTIIANQSPISGNSSTPVTAILTGLIDGTTYHYRVKAVNSLGTTYGNDVSFTTLTWPEVITTPISSITISTITSGGNVISDGGSAILSRGICWSTSPSPTVDLITKTSDGNGTGIYNSTITGLTSNITYYLRAYATNSVGTSYGEEFSTTLWLLMLGPQATDIDGNTYNSRKIGNQIWISSNLKTTKYNNGDLIGTTSPATLNISGEISPKYQWAYNGDAGSVLSYGRLYTWYVITDNRNICPTGWHIPTETEWIALVTYLGGESIAGDFLKEAGTAHWMSPNPSTNKSGFSAVGGGIRFSNGFDNLQRLGYYWSSSQNNEDNAWYWIMGYSGQGASKYETLKTEGLSVRCIKD